MAPVRSGTPQAAGFAAGTSIVVTLPTGLTDGDLILLNFNTQAAGNDATIAASGWTRHAASGQSGGGVQNWLFWKVFATGDPATVTVANSVSSAGGYETGAYSGCDTSAPLGTAAVSTNASQTNLVVSSITTTKANSFGIVCCGTGSGSAAFNTLPTGYSTVATATTQKTGNLSDQSFPTAGTTTGALSYTLSVAAQGSSIQVELFAAASSATAAPTAPRPRAFQEQGGIYSGEQTGFQPLAFQIPDPGRAFQESDGFQPQAFQVPDPTVAFQPEAFDDSASFQMSVVAFQEPTGFQGDAFQEGPGLERRTPRTIVVGKNAAGSNRTRFIRARQHRQARILRAPQPPPAAAPTVVKQTILVSEDRRAARVARLRRRKPTLLRAPLVAQARRPSTVEKTTINRAKLVARRRRKPQLLRAPLVSAPPANRLQVHERIRPKLARIRQRKPILLRAPSVPTPPPVTGTPVKRVFVYGDRRAAYARARVRRKQILRGVSVPTPVPLIRVNVKVVRRNRRAVVARLRHEQPRIVRAPVAAVRTPKQIVVRQQRRRQKKRTRALVVRSLPVWQQPGYRHIQIAGNRRKAGVVARARRKLRYLVSHVYGPPPPPSTASAYGSLFLSDVPVFGETASDLLAYSAGISDRAVYDTTTGELLVYGASSDTRPVVAAGTDDTPGR